MSKQPLIDWDYSGPSDPLCGTGATSSERLLAHGSAAFLTLVILVLDKTRATPISSGWSSLALAVLAYDVAGGAVANMLNSCKRYYHSGLRPGEGTGAWLAKNVRVFTAGHVQPILAAWLFGGNLVYSGVWYGALQLAVAVVLAAPLYLRRSLATAITLLVILVNGALMPLGSGLEWFIPCLFIKMVMGHAVREEPYRPVE